MKATDPGHFVLSRNGVSLIRAFEVKVNLLNFGSFLAGASRANAVVI